MGTPSDDDPAEQLVAALSNGVACLYALVSQMDSGAPRLATDGERWESALTALEWAMAELRTNKLITSGYQITPEDVARVHLLRVQLQGGEGSPDLRRLAVESLERLSSAAPARTRPRTRTERRRTGRMRHRKGIASPPTRTTRTRRRTPSTLVDCLTSLST